MDVRHVVCGILLVICGLYLLSFIFGLIWLKFQFKWGDKFYHDFMGWHIPDDSLSHDGCSFHSRCKICGKDIMQDSQGNWF